MFGRLAKRKRLIAKFRKVAMTRGADFVRTWDRSSSKVTSRTQCKPFSMAQCPRLSSSNRCGVARSAGALVMAKATSWRSGRPVRSVVLRSIRMTCCEEGNAR